MNTIQYSPEAVRYMQQDFPGPTRVLDANGISIASAVFARLTRWQTKWQTNRPCYSVFNNRRSARTVEKPNSVIVYGYNKYLLEQSTQIHHARLSFVSVHQMAPPLTEVGDIQLQLTTHLSTRRDERLSWPVGWPILQQNPVTFFLKLAVPDSAEGVALDFVYIYIRYHNPDGHGQNTYAIRSTAPPTCDVGSFADVKT